MTLDIIVILLLVIFLPIGLGIFATKKEELLKLFEYWLIGVWGILFILFGTAVLITTFWCIGALLRSVV